MAVVPDVIGNGFHDVLEPKNVLERGHRPRLPRSTKHGACAYLWNGGSSVRARGVPVAPCIEGVSVGVRETRPRIAICQCHLCARCLVRLHCALLTVALPQLLLNPFPPSRVPSVKIRDVIFLGPRAAMPMPILPRAAIPMPIFRRAPIFLR